MEGQERIGHDNSRIEKCEEDVKRVESQYKLLDTKFDKFVDNDFDHVKKDIKKCKNLSEQTSKAVSFIKGQLFVLIPLMLAVIGFFIQHLMV